MSPLRLVVVGVGALGRHHARILSAQPDVELVAVIDGSPENGPRVAESCNTRWLTDPSEILDQVDAAVIAVPTCAHRAVAAPFLERGLAVLVEKPLAGNRDDAEALVRLADRCGAILQVGHVERFNPATQVARELCGAPKYVRSERVSPFSFRSTDIGVVHDLMIHDIDLTLDFVRSPVRSVDAFGLAVMGGCEDLVQARIVFESGCVADLTASRVHPEAKRTMQVWSTAGTVSIDFTSREVVSYALGDALRFGPSPLEKARRPGADLATLRQEVFGKLIRVDRPDVSDADALTLELRSFLDCARERSTPAVDGRQALAALDLADRILKQAAAHQWDGHAHGPIGLHPLPTHPLRAAG